MNLLKRAGLYTLRSMGRTALLFAILLLVATFVLSGLSVMEASENTSTELRGTTGASFTVERNLATGSMNNIGGGTSIIQQEFLNDEMIDKILKIDGITAYTAKNYGYYDLKDTSGQSLQMIYSSSKWDGTDLDFTSTTIGSFFTEYDEFFLSQRFQLTQGRHLTDQDDKGILISEDLAKKHGLSVGDKVELYRQNWTTGAANAGDKGEDVEIVGLFKIIETQDDINSLSPSDRYENYVFAPIRVVQSLSDWVGEEEQYGYQYADFYVDDPQRLDGIIQDVQKIDSVNWNNFLVSANNEVYQRAAGSMSNVATLIHTLILVIVVMSAGIITLILFFWLKGRIRETGILMAMGISKTALLFQHMVETALIAIPAFCSAWILSEFFAGWIGSLFDSNIAAGSVAVSGGDFAAVCIGGTLILSAAIFVSCIPVFRYKPKEILSMME